MAFTTIDGFALDLVVSEEHGLESEITEHQVEDGADISDNIRNKPRTLSLSNAVVSDHPIGEIARDPSRVLVDKMTPASRLAWRKLVAIWEDKQPVVIVTNFERYDSMGLESVTVPRESKTHGGLVFTAKFKSIRIVRNKRVKIAVANGGPRQNLGLRQAHNPDRHHILWRKGNPPGTDPTTTPFGVITGTEIVFADDTTVFGTGKGTATRFFHDVSGLPLSAPEEAAFFKDMARDNNEIAAKYDQKPHNPLDGAIDIPVLNGRPQYSNPQLADDLHGTQPVSAPRDVFAPTILNPTKPPR